MHDVVPMSPSWEQVQAYEKRIPISNEMERKIFRWNFSDLNLKIDRFGDHITEP